MSALSAISARRRLAGESGQVDSPPTTPAPKTAKGSANAFSVLQNLSRHGDSPAVAANRTPRSAVRKREDKKMCVCPNDRKSDVSSNTL